MSKHKRKNKKRNIQNVPIYSDKNIVVKDKNLPSIFVSYADLTGSDITKMSDFLEAYNKCSPIDLAAKFDSRTTKEIPLSEIQIGLKLLQKGEPLLYHGDIWIPAYDKLPVDIQEKLKKGIYHIGKSKQVAGNIRSAIFDENNVEVKEITFKQTEGILGGPELGQQFVEQMQWRQINNKLDTITTLQEYQIERDRNRDIDNKFLTARDYIVEAMDTDDAEQKRKKLEQADVNLAEAFNAVRTDIRSSSKQLAQVHDLSLFRQIFKTKERELFMTNLLFDIQTAGRITGVRMWVQDSLGDDKALKRSYSNYHNFLNEFFTETYGKKELTAPELLHNFTKYSEENMDMWMKLPQNFQPLLSGRGDIIDAPAVYQLSIEGKDSDHE